MYNVYKFVTRCRAPAPIPCPVRIARTEPDCPRTRGALLRAVVEPPLSSAAQVRAAAPTVAQGGRNGDTHSPGLLLRPVSPALPAPASGPGWGAGSRALPARLRGRGAARGAPGQLPARPRAETRPARGCPLRGTPSRRSDGDRRPSLAPPRPGSRLPLSAQLSPHPPTLSVIIIIILNIFGVCFRL